MTSLPEFVKSLNVAFLKQDYTSCQKILSPIKVELIKHNLLIPDFNNTDENYINDLNVSKKILEVGALVSIFTLDFEAFQNYFSQIRLYYFLSNSSILSESENKYKLISLYLLITLSNGDISKFHSELEYLSKTVENLEEDPLISYPIKVEKYLMEGAYQKAWELINAGSKVPEFEFFAETLIAAIREEIAHNTELSYSQLHLTNIKVLLFLDSEKNAEAFAIEKGWTVNGGIVNFNTESNELKNEIIEDDTARSKIIEHTLDYAINLESIV